VPSPLGEILLIGEGGRLCGLYMKLESGWLPRTQLGLRDDAALPVVREQLAQYFDGARREFDLPLQLEGTEFQRRAWEALLEIPYGETRSYGEQARRIGLPDAARAVGAANGQNPVSIIVPCHRVIGANGALTGYGGGIERKRWLLAHEAQQRRLI
jgi:methylated-DNA-[protein]-cysteine S-methyltransferase